MSERQRIGKAEALKTPNYFKILAQCLLRRFSYWTTNICKQVGKVQNSGTFYCFVSDWKDLALGNSFLSMD
jgi:hypothetical protein